MFNTNTSQNRDVCVISWRLVAGCRGVDRCIFKPLERARLAMSPCLQSLCKLTSRAAIIFLAYCNWIYFTKFNVSLERQVIVLSRTKIWIEKLAELGAARSLVDVYQPPLRRAPVNSKRTQAQTREPRAVPLGEDVWEKLEEWYSRGRGGREGGWQSKEGVKKHERWGRKWRIKQKQEGRVGGGRQKSRDVRDERVQDLGEKEKVWWTWCILETIEKRQEEGGKE